MSQSEEQRHAIRLQQQQLMMQQQAQLEAIAKDAAARATEKRAEQQIRVQGGIHTVCDNGSDASMPGRVEVRAPTAGEIEAAVQAREKRVATVELAEGAAKKRPKVSDTEFEEEVAQRGVQRRPGLGVIGVRNKRVFIQNESTVYSV